MKNYTTILLAVLLFSACSNKKHQKDDKQMAASEEKLMEDGFEKGRIVHDEEAEAPCDYLILVNDQLLEPMEMDKEFKSGKMNVWVKFTRQRRQPRCGEAQPVDITAIKKRE